MNRALYNYIIGQIIGKVKCLTSGVEYSAAWGGLGRKNYWEKKFDKKKKLWYNIIGGGGLS